MKARIKYGLLILMVLAVAAGCAPTNVTQQPTDMTATQLARPALVLVYDFAVSPDEVKLDKGLSADLMQKYEQYKGMSRTAEEIKVGHRVADALAEEMAAGEAVRDRLVGAVLNGE